MEADAKIGQEKRAQRLAFWVRRPPGGVGVFRAKGWWPKTSCPPSKVCLPWVSKRRIWDVPRILLGCPGPLGVFKKFVQKKFVFIFRSLEEEHDREGQKKPRSWEQCLPQSMKQGGGNVAPVLSKPWSGTEEQPKEKVLRQKRCRTKSPRIFFFEFSTRTFRGFLVLCCLETETIKNHQNPCNFSMPNSQATPQKRFPEFLWRAAKVRKFFGQDICGRLGGYPADVQGSFSPVLFSRFFIFSAIDW